ncbi:MAG: prephenate dehydrogenase dimerization domain-containing protein, partial [Candidatus Scalindua sp.]
KHWKFAASGLRDTTRVASGDPELWLGICKQNKVRIIKALRCFSKEVKYTLNDLEQGNYNKILKRLQMAKMKRDRKKW